MFPHNGIVLAKIAVSVMKMPNGHMGCWLFFCNVIYCCMITVKPDFRDHPFMWHGNRYRQTVVALIAA